MPLHKVLGVDPVRKRVDLAMPPAIKALSADDLFTAFCLALERSFSFEVNVKRLVEQRADILLCLFSILHFSQMPDLDKGPPQGTESKSRAGYLGLNTWEGKYHLYAGVMKSDVEALLAAGSERRERPFINTFPVFNGYKEVGRGPAMDIFNPAVVFAVRDASGQLVLSASGDASSKVKSA